ncbi:hypothetical protein NE237_008596 [Protea cynaroides]|uniref:Uncharacterized protein n=1 Tax=Protea cynaroides TaxID=273540 RepID=A0A9Q0KW64_9MAGN|nr:hypothetical protein NE237_008596 [Protea cynaroides]
MAGVKTKGACRCCPKEGLKRGAWSAQEDRILTSYINIHGEGKWRELPLKAGLRRCGRSCRLRWLNYLRPDIKRGNISKDEEDLIIRLHKLLGNRWSLIAGRLPGRTDNEIKNYWNTNLSKRMKGITKKIQRKKLKNKKLKGIPEVKVENNPHIIQARATQCNNIELVLGGESWGGRINDSSDFILDTDLDEFRISDFLDSDFFQGHCDEIQAANNATGGDDGINNNLSCCFGHPSFPTHETIEKSSSEAMLENEVDSDSAQPNLTWEVSRLCSFLETEKPPNDREPVPAPAPSSIDRDLASSIGAFPRNGYCSCEFLICLLLTLLGYIPGIIYAIHAI